MGCPSLVEMRAFFRLCGAAPLSADCHAATVLSHLLSTFCSLIVATFPRKRIPTVDLCKYSNFFLTKSQLKRLCDVRQLRKTGMWRTKLHHYRSETTENWPLTRLKVFCFHALSIALSCSYARAFRVARESRIRSILRAGKP